MATFEPKRPDSLWIELRPSTINQSPIAQPAATFTRKPASTNAMKDSLAALEALGFTLPSTAYLIGVVIFGIVGYIAYRHGKKKSLPATKWIGIALMLYPYAIPATWLLYVVGAGLCVGVYLSARP